MTATLTYPTLDDFTAHIDTVNVSDDPEAQGFGLVEAFLLNLLMRWEAEDRGLTSEDSHLKEVNETITAISGMISDEERLSVVTHLVIWQGQEGWLAERLLSARTA